MGTMATGVRINTTQGMIIYRNFIIQESIDGWEWTHEDYGHDATPQYLQVAGTCQTMFECIDEIENWHDNRAEAAWLDHQQSLRESGGPDSSAYRRDMIAAGRGHLLGGK